MDKDLNKQKELSTYFQEMASHNDNCVLIVEEIKALYNSAIKLEREVQFLNEKSTFLKAKGIQNYPGFVPNFKAISIQSIVSDDSRLPVLGGLNESTIQTVVIRPEEEIEEELILSNEMTGLLSTLEATSHKNQAESPAISLDQTKLISSELSSLSIASTTNSLPGKGKNDNRTPSIKRKSAKKNDNNNETPKRVKDEISNGESVSKESKGPAKSSITIKRLSSKKQINYIDESQQ